MMVVAIVIMVIATLAGAAAFEVEDSYTFVVKRGMDLSNVLPIYSYSNAEIEVSTDSQFITIDGRDSATISANMIAFDGIASVPYTISIPEEIEIGYYREKIIIEDSSQREIVNVNLKVQNDIVYFFSKITQNEIFGIKGFRFSTLLLILAMILIFLFFLYVLRSSLEGTKNAGFFIVLSLLFVGILFAGWFMIMHTNVYLKGAGTNFSKNIYLSSEEASIAKIELARDSRTLAALDWVMFDNGYQYIVVDVPEGAQVQAKMHISLPLLLESKRYYVSYEIEWEDGKKEEKTFSFLTRS
jgi:hypothetical protein